MPRLILLHGWGVDARIWAPLAAHWPDAEAPACPDWPGYGTRAALGAPGDLDALADAMAAALPADAVWVGWSLGGLLAAALSLRLPAPQGLVMLGMGPRFCHPAAVNEAALGDFQRAFSRAPEASWRHFLRWQSGGEPSPRDTYRQLTRLLGDTPPATLPTLSAGLAQLSQLDAQHLVPAPPCPVAWLYGTRDPLLAPSGLPSGAEALPDSGHCAMLSQPVALARALQRLAGDFSHASTMERR
ncbi:pimeloyl-[acyl-carrier protein] methyl ester esterase [Franzmannia pantelleriensis]|uniref:Pimeloyl-[acyl-carrier protein] methyl ester esterase n=1 Tax=Franzmannia pantelleriensis TaxID=48727 RepID=A0A1G9VMB9_9GAMM|nr:alpha/beta fold hydrolase [Halomonas pantelleriensis]SDM73250.1 pimeloyl-[acyl-carrier protein] methyl ester esterase [Halomonas pantelleriensis]